LYSLPQSYNQTSKCKRCISSNAYEQGDGFFKLAEELGFGNWKKLKNGKMFEYEMINKAHNFWSK